MLALSFSNNCQIFETHLAIGFPYNPMLRFCPLTPIFSFENIDIMKSPEELFVCPFLKPLCLDISPKKVNYNKMFEPVSLKSTWTYVFMNYPSILKILKSNGDYIINH